MAEAVGEGLAFLDSHVCLLALLGLAIFSGLERATTASRRRRRAVGTEDGPRAGVFWLHIGSCAADNALIGHVLLQRAEDSDGPALVLFAVAMGLHVVVNDDGLREHHQKGYARIGRWVLVAALLLGWAVGFTGKISEAAPAALLAFLAGGVILNVLKEKLPEERESRSWVFALGAATDAAILLAL